METSGHSEACLSNTSSEPADIYAKVSVFSNKTEPHRTLSPKWGVCHLPCCHHCVSTDPGPPAGTISTVSLLCLGPAHTVPTSPARRA